MDDVQEAHWDRRRDAARRRRSVSPSAIRTAWAGRIRRATSRRFAARSYGDYDFPRAADDRGDQPGQQRRRLVRCRGPAHRHQHDDRRQAVCRRTGLFDRAADAAGFGAGAAGFAEEESDSERVRSRSARCKDATTIPDLRLHHDLHPTCSKSSHVTHHEHRSTSPTQSRQREAAGVRAAASARAAGANGGRSAGAVSARVSDQQLADGGRRAAAGAEPPGGSHAAAQLSAHAAAVPDALARVSSEHRAARDLRRRPLGRRRVAANRSSSASARCWPTKATT